MLAMLGNFEGYKPKLPGSRIEGDAGITEMEDRLYGMSHARLGSRMAQTWLLPDDVCAAILWHHDYAALADGTAGVSPAGQRNIAVTLAAQYVYCLNKMGLHDAEWKRGATFALAQLGLAQTEQRDRLLHRTGFVAQSVKRRVDRLQHRGGQAHIATDQFAEFGEIGFVSAHLAHQRGRCRVAFEPRPVRHR